MDQYSNDEITPVFGNDLYKSINFLKSAPAWMVFLWFKYVHFEHATIYKSKGKLQTQIQSYQSYFPWQWASQAVAQMCSVKKVFLEISQNSQP